MDNHSLIERIKSADSEGGLEEIYRQFRNEFILWAVRHHSCTMEEAKDIFQQTVIIFYENIIYGKLREIKTQVKTYLFGIGKNKILELIREKSKRYPEFNEELYGDSEYFFQEVDDDYEDQLKIVEKGLNQLGNPCRDILAQYYYCRKSMMQISEALGYKNSDTVKNLKYKCLQRLRHVLRDRLAG